MGPILLYSPYCETMMGGAMSPGGVASGALVLVTPDTAPRTRSSA